MKKLFQVVFLLTVVFITANSVQAKSAGSLKAADPITIEITTKHSSINDALLAAKAALLKQKFILDGTMGEKSFTSKRTTGSKADYYVADVTGSMESGKAKLSITFVKVGTGLLKVKKMADAVKADLEK